MRRATLGFLVLGLTIRTTLCQCDGSSISVFGGTRSIKAPGHPEVRTVESCAWDFYLPSAPKILIMNITDIQLYYAYGDFMDGKNYVECSGTLKVGSYNVRNKRRCSNKDPFCRVYYNSNECQTAMSKMKDIKLCADRGNPSNPISVTFTSDGKSGWRYEATSKNYARGFKMEYKYVNCLPETTTTTTFEPKTISNNPTTKPQILNFSREVSTLISTTTNATGVGSGDNQQDGTDPILPIVVAVGVLILILMAAVGVLVYMKKKRSKTQDSQQENEYQELDVQVTENGNLARVTAGPSVGYEPFYSNTGIIQSENYVGGINQSHDGEYSTINLTQFNQSASPVQVINQSESEEYHALNHTNQTVNQSDAGEYSMLALEHSFHQSSFQNVGTSQSAASATTQPVYSTVNKTQNTQLTHAMDRSNQSEEIVYSTVNKSSNPNRPRKKTIRYSVRHSNV